MKRKIAKLFKNLCCSRCKEDFNENSVIIMREEEYPEESVLVIKLVCQHCGKSFGIAFLGVNSVELKDEEEIEDKTPLSVQDGFPPINADDVINAHNFIKNLDNDWQKYLPNN